MIRKLTLFMTAAAGLFLFVSDSRAAQAAPPAVDVGQELRTLERKWLNALMASDTDTLNGILAETYIDTDEQGYQSDKKGLLAALKSGDLKYTQLQLSRMKVYSYVYAAVVAGVLTQNGTFKGEKLPTSDSFTAMFMMIDGSWKVIACHRSAPTPKPAAAAK